MAILKCKMCGGDLELLDGKGYGTCQYCGSTMTLPKASDERKANLFNRANHFRRANEFDKAVAAYESILNEDNADAEAHWGVVLSKYGIEYVEDPKTHDRVPICHRVQVDSVLTDADYLAAIENSPNGYTKELYEKEAKRISEVQNSILAISRQEEPFDVFICYKETTDEGTRTKDSTLAQEIYHQLKQESYKVFFAKITLEDKLGQQYEPYIFAALNSAKVMVIVGTKPEYFEAIWVKNEWSRFLSITKKDRNKLLIPCYKDMDAHDLPDELSSLQSQDMSKIGFIQDLIRGIKKVLDAGKQPIVATTIAQVHGSTSESLLKRAFLCIEDGDFKKADDLLEQVLNRDPENARAYIGKLMVKLRINQEDELKNQTSPLSNHSEYAKAVRFANEEYKKVIEDHNKQVLDKIAKAKEQRDREHREHRERIEAEEQRQDKIYNEAISAKKMSKSSEDYTSAACKFRSLDSFKDAETLAVECDELAHKAQAVEEHERAKKEERRILQRARNVKIAWIISIVAIFAGFLRFYAVENEKKLQAEIKMNETKKSEEIKMNEAPKLEEIKMKETKKLLEYCKNGTVQQVESAIKSGADIHAKDQYGWTALMLAVSYNTNSEIIATLIKSGADIRAKDKYGWTALMFAARNNTNPEIVATLIKSGADVHAKNQADWTALMFAARNNTNPETVATLIKLSADVNAKNRSGWTALMFAASNNANPEIVATLIKSGADVHTKNKDGLTALDYAKKNDKLKNTEAYRTLESMTRK